MHLNLLLAPPLLLLAPPLLLAFLPHRAAACTTVAVGARASASGFPMCSHSNDGDGDVAGRLRQIGAGGPWPAGARRPTTHGSIPQVATTYAYKTEGYAIANGFNVGLCESTCAAIFDVAAGWGARGNLTIVDLGQIALERATSAYSAVQIMGSLAVAHGYRDAGESLLVVDPADAFIFHVLPDPTNASAIWVAQRITDDAVAVVANAFTIGAVAFPLSTRRGDGLDFLGSENLVAVAEARGLYDPKRDHGVFDFSKIYSRGELGPKYNTGRRMWEAYRLLAPEVEMSPTYEHFLHAYPASLQVAPGSVEIEDVFSVMRSYYQGTPYDLSKFGLDEPSDYPVAAGSAGSSFRAHAGAAEARAFPDGRWERSIAIWKTQASVVVCTGLSDAGRSRDDSALSSGSISGRRGIIWFAPHAAHTAVYMPFLTGDVGDPPLPAAVCGPAVVSSVNRSYSFWANRYVFTMAQMRFDLAIQDVAAARAPLERQAASLVASLPADGAAAAARLSAHAASVVRAWWALSEQLLVWYAEGNCNGCPHATGSGRHFGYPAWWLKDAGYADPLP
jgi:dipeptidase